MSNSSARWEGQDKSRERQLSWRGAFLFITLHSKEPGSLSTEPEWQPLAPLCSKIPFLRTVLFSHPRPISPPAWRGFCWMLGSRITVPPNTWEWFKHNQEKKKIIMATMNCRVHVGVDMGFRWGRHQEWWPCPAAGRSRAEPRKGRRGESQEPSEHTVRATGPGLHRCPLTASFVKPNLEFQERCLMYTPQQAGYCLQ